MATGTVPPVGLSLIFRLCYKSATSYRGKEYVPSATPSHPICCARQEYVTGSDFRIHTTVCPHITLSGNASRKPPTITRPCLLDNDERQEKTPMVTSPEYEAGADPTSQVIPNLREIRLPWPLEGLSNTRICFPWRFQLVTLVGLRG